MNEKSQEYGGILPCGGRGTRLVSLTEDLIPKSLYKVNERELIQYSIDILRPELVKRLVFAVDHKAEEMKRWVNAQQLPHIVHFSEQVTPGVLGSIVAGASHIQEDEMVACNTDEIRAGLNLFDMIRFHETNGTLATMATTYTNRLNRHRVVNVRQIDGRVTSTKLKPEEYKGHPEQIGLVNTGFLIINKRAMEYFNPEHSTDWGGVIDPLVDAGQLSAYIDRRILYFNVGTVDEYSEAQNQLGNNSADS